MTSTSLLRRALDLAANGIGQVFKGPYVGWVLTQHGQIQQEGWLEGEKHLSDCFSAYHPQPNQTLFLNTNPFANPAALESFCRKYAIKQYYLATDNPALSSTEYHLNHRYYTWQQQKRPYIILKWAQTADSFIARSNYDARWISNPLSRKLVHQWRAEEAAIWAGKNTYQHDNPRLNVRDWTGSDPVRIIIDKNLSLNPTWHVFDQAQPTLCYNFVKNETNRNLEYVKLVADEHDWSAIITCVLDDLYQRSVQSVFVEGGAVLLNFLIQKNLWDEARVFQSLQTFGQGIPAPVINEKYAHFTTNIDRDRLTCYRRT